MSQPKHYYWDNANSRYKAEVQREGEKHHIGYANTEDEIKLMVARWMANYHQTLADEWFDIYTQLLEEKEEREAIERDQEAVVGIVDRRDTDAFGDDDNWGSNPVWGG